MICPSCNAHFWPSQAMRKNLKSLDSVDISYDIHCPYCSTLSGRMFWGRLITPHGNSAAPTAMPQAAQAAAEEQTPHKPRSETRRRGERRRSERRGGERRREDRRQQALPFSGPERRKADRRQGDRRCVDRRQTERRQNDRRQADALSQAQPIASPAPAIQKPPATTAHAASATPPSPKADPRFQAGLGAGSGRNLNKSIGKHTSASAPEAGGTVRTPTYNTYALKQRRRAYPTPRLAGNAMGNGVNGIAKV